jgi:hypothetical protein
MGIELRYYSYFIFAIPAFHTESTPCALGQGETRLAILLCNPSLSETAKEEILKKQTPIK